MIKAFGLLIFLLISAPTHAEDCARNLNELKTLVGNSDLPLNWKENTKKNPLVLNLKNGSGALIVKLTSPKGEWATINGMICKKSDHYVARVQDKIIWGAAAPGIVKGSNMKELKLKLPYQSLLKVSVSVFSFEFSPLP